MFRLTGKNAGWGYIFFSLIPIAWGVVGISQSLGDWGGLGCFSVSLVLLFLGVVLFRRGVLIVQNPYDAWRKPMIDYLKKKKPDDNQEDKYQDRW